MWQRWPVFGHDSAMRGSARVPLRGLVGLVSSLVLLACGAPAGDAPQAEEAGPAAVVATPDEVSDEVYAERYNAAKQRIADLDSGNPMVVKGAVNELGPELRKIAEGAADKHLRANASLLAGSLYDLAGDSRSAIAFYRQAHGLLPDDIEPVRILALSLGRDGQYAEAAKLQEKVVADDMDDLAAWLLQGELLLKAGEEEEAKKAYIRYEIRRKGLLDGLTLQKDGVFVTAAEDRAVIAGALTPASDNGTAIALLYALKYEPDAKVRAAILETMGIQRLAGYQKAIEERLAIESDPVVKEVAQWALDEIKRDPLDTRPGAPPELVADAPAEGETAAEADGDAKIGAPAEGDPSAEPSAPEPVKNALPGGEGDAPPDPAPSPS